MEETMDEVVAVADYVQSVKVGRGLAKITIMEPMRLVDGKDKELNEKDFTKLALLISQKLNKRLKQVKLKAIKRELGVGTAFTLASITTDITYKNVHFASTSIALQSIMLTKSRDSSAQAIRDEVEAVIDVFTDLGIIDEKDKFYY